MIRQPVASTNIRSVGYCNNVLEIEFLNGSVYQYTGVPVHHYEHMIAYAHPGTYLAANVKGVYNYRRVA